LCHAEDGRRGFHVTGVQTCALPISGTMTLVVKKFGGTSVGSPERIRAVAERVAHARAQGERVALVVSAMGSATDELLTLASTVGSEERRVGQGGRRRHEARSRRRKR